jgi:hypothetical protein
MNRWYFKFSDQTSLIAMDVAVPAHFTTEDVIDHLAERYPDAEGLILAWPAD